MGYYAFTKADWYLAAKLNAHINKRGMYRIHKTCEIWLEIKFCLNFNLL